MLNPFIILNIEENADDEAVRAAYVRAIRQSPPDRDPDGFRRIREAYEAISDTEKRLAFRLFGPPPLPQLEDMFALIPDDRQHVGPALWLNILRKPQPGRPGRPGSQG
jgi:curved DNA-binding protein CbpA